MFPVGGQRETYRSNVAMALHDSEIGDEVGAQRRFQDLGVYSRIFNR